LGRAQQLLGMKGLGARVLALEHAIRHDLFIALPPLEQRWLIQRVLPQSQRPSRFAPAQEARHIHGSPARGARVLALAHAIRPALLSASDRQEQPSVIHSAQPPSPPLSRHVHALPQRRIRGMRARGAHVARARHRVIRREVWSVRALPAPPSSTHIAQLPSQQLSSHVLAPRLIRGLRAIGGLVLAHHHARRPALLPV
jgi:hypothetical protein